MNARSGTAVSIALAASLLLGACSGDQAGSSELTVDGQVTGSLSPFKSEKEYSLQIEEAGVYRFDMQSAKLDSMLALRGPGINLSDDDSGGSLNARITAYLEPGQYWLNASGFSSPNSGTFTLSATRRAFPAGVTPQNGGPLPVPGRVYGIYTGQALSYELDIPRDTLAIIDMRSADFDSTLSIMGEDTEAYDDDGGRDYDARLVVSLKQGRYTVVADSADEERVGLFALKTQLLEAVPNDGDYLTPGTAVSGYLKEGEDGRQYELKIDVAGHYVIDMMSSDLDSYLHIRGPGVNQSDDDSGSGSSLNARLSLRLRPGIYRVRASAYDDETSGTYVLTVSAPDRRSPIH